MYFLAVSSPRDPRGSADTDHALDSTAEMQRHGEVLADTDSDTAALATTQLPGGSRAYSYVPHVVVTGALADLLDAEHLRAALLSALGPAMAPSAGARHVNVRPNRSGRLAVNSLLATCHFPMASHPGSFGSFATSIYSARIGKAESCECACMIMLLSACVQA